MPIFDITRPTARSAPTTEAIQLAKNRYGAQRIFARVGRDGHRAEASR
jgi:hypothetical protein